MMLIDKSYYDYDYDPTKKPIKAKAKTQAEVSAMLKRFGFNTNIADTKAEVQETGEQLAERLQSEAMSRRHE